MKSLDNGDVENVGAPDLDAFSDVFCEQTREFVASEHTISSSEKPRFLWFSFVFHASLFLARDVISLPCLFGKRRTVEMVMSILLISQIWVPSQMFLANKLVNL